MNIENAKTFDDDFEKRPTKDIYEKCLLELYTEKHNIILNENYDKKLINKIDKVLESIHIYLSVASK
jgi:hypothetical protein